MLTEKQRCEAFQGRKPVAVMAGSTIARTGYTIAVDVNGKPGAFATAGVNGEQYWTLRSAEALVFHTRRAARVYADKHMSGKLIISKYAGK